MPDLIYSFGPFRLDVCERQLSRGGQIIPLRGKIFDTLLILVENQGRLVRKHELMSAVWPDSVVEENNLDHNLSAIRNALGQRRGDFEYIETVPRQGYRFVARVEASGIPSGPRLGEGTMHCSCIVERELQVSQLRTAFERAKSGTRQVVFITGEPGVGKTTLVRAFAEEIAGTRGARLARGDCQDSHGEGEPYMPVLEALSRLAREDNGYCVEVLRKCAPSWLTQLPSIPSGGHAQLPRLTSPGITAERMLREATDALELLTAQYPLVFILEDLHWADYSTVDLLARLAQRTEPARLFIIGTHRPSDAKARSHPIHATANHLKLRGYCLEIPLGFLTRDGVAQYLQARFGNTPPAMVIERLHARTQGNPLFVATVVDSWLVSGCLRNGETGLSLSDDAELSFDVSDDLRVLIEQQVAELDPADREIIEAASVAGPGFCPAAIAPALGRATSEVETRCAALARLGRFFVAAGAEEWPDGTICEAYTFLHSVHRDVVYECMPAGRRVRLHQQIGERIEQGHGEFSDEIAAELAVHFREARDAPRVLRYSRRAAEQSLARSAHREAIVHLTNALAMLPRLPDLDERARHEVDLLSLLAPALVATKGFADPEAERAFRRAYELSAQIEGCSTHFPVAFGLAVMLEVRGQYSNAQELMERHLPEQERRGEFFLEARDLLACSRFHQGAFKDALDHGEQGSRAYSPEYHSAVSAALGEDPGIDCHAWAALALWFLGYPDQALTRGRLAVSLCRDPSRLYSLAYAQTQLAILHQLRREEEEALEWAKEAISLATKQGYPYRRAVGQVLLGWALACRGDFEMGLRQLQEGLDCCADLGAELDRPYHLALLAEAHIAAGQPAEARAVLNTALTRIEPGFFYSAEIYRLLGVTAVQCREAPEVAEQWMARSLETAASQSALSLELRTAVALADLVDRLGERGCGRQRLAEAYARFTEGFETLDLRLARKHLETVTPETSESRIEDAHGRAPQRQNEQQGEKDAARGSGRPILPDCGRKLHARRDRQSQCDQAGGD